MPWSDLRVIDSRQIATPLTAGGDLSLCPDGPVAVVPTSVTVDPSAYGAGIWVSLTPMTETVKELDDSDRVVATHDREELLVADYPVVADGALLREAPDGEPDDVLRWLVSRGPVVRSLAPDPAGR